MNVYIVGLLNVISCWGASWGYLWGDERSRGGRVVGLLAEWIALAAGAKVMMGLAGLMAQCARLCGVEHSDMPAEEE